MILRSSITLVALVSLAFPAGVSAADRDHVPATADLPPDGVSASDWSSIRAAYEANRHAAFAVEGGYVARNPGQRWRTKFDGRGFETTPDAGGWSWGLELVSYGRVEQSPDPLRFAPGASRQGGVGSRARGLSDSETDSSLPIAALSACGQRVEYEWNETLTEWFINDTRGLEHGFTVHKRPVDEQSPDRKGGVGSPWRGPSESQSDRSLTTCPWREAKGVASRQSVAAAPLQFTLVVRGGLQPRISGDGRNAAFVSDTGAAVVNYNGLTVLDATGAAVPAWFEDARGLKSEANDQTGLSPFAIRHSTFLRIIVDDSEAIYPLTIDPIAQQAYLKASNTEALDSFGAWVAVSGDTVVVGAPTEDSSATGVNGNQADNSAEWSGAAYVFVRDANGLWSQQAYLKASNTGAQDRFGQSVAVSGDTVVVGAFDEDSSATGVNGNEADNSAADSGAAYVFVRDSNGVWSQQAYLKASNTGADDWFGGSVAASGDTVVVGAFAEDSSATGVNGNGTDNSASFSGAAYVFVRSGGVWSQQAYLKASNTGGNDFFGWSVAVSGDTVVVAARLEASSATGVDGNQADNSAYNSGAAYVFVRDGNDDWSQQAYLKASNTAVSDFFGTSVAASGDTVVVGANFEESSATGVNGNQADNSAADSGAAYVFVCDDSGVWSQQAYLKASNTEAGDQFGWSVAVSGDTVVVGAQREDSSATGVDGNGADNSAGDSGAAYVFVRDGNGVWSQQAYLKASNTGAQDRFGYSVAVSGETVVVAATQEDSSATGVNSDQADNSATNSGAAYVFTLTAPCPTLGDMNCDCAVDLADVSPFVQALLDPVGYAAAYPTCNILNADMQPDGNVDGGDVQGFIGLLIP